MRATAAAALLALLALLPPPTAAQATPCAGEFSRCPNGVCALVAPQQCNQCAAGQYACPMSAACVASADAFTSCPGLKGTHFDATLSVEARLDYIFAQKLTVAELITQMTDNATEIPRLGIPKCAWWRRWGRRSPRRCEVVCPWRVSAQPR